MSAATELISVYGPTLPAPDVRVILAGLAARNAPTRAVREGLRVDALVAMRAHADVLPYDLVVRLLDELLPYAPPARRYWEWARLAQTPDQQARVTATAAVAR